MQFTQEKSNDELLVKIYFIKKSNDHVTLTLKQTLLL